MSRRENSKREPFVMIYKWVEGSGGGKGTLCLQKCDATEFLLMMDSPASPSRYHEHICISPSNTGYKRLRRRGFQGSLPSLWGHRPEHKMLGNIQGKKHMLVTPEFYRVKGHLEKFTGRKVGR